LECLLGSEGGGGKGYGPRERMDRSEQSGRSKRSIVLAAQLRKRHSLLRKINAPVGNQKGKSPALFSKWLSTSEPYKNESCRLKSREQPMCVGEGSNGEGEKRGRAIAPRFAG